MQLTTALYKYSIVLFAVFVALAVLGFWITYYSSPFELSPRGSLRIVHFHGAIMTLWCVLLILQPLLIRANRRDLHSIIGRSSYVLAPTIVIIGILATHGDIAVRDDSFVDGVVSDAAAVRVSLFLGIAVFFAILYGLAILYRRDPPTHARFMLATIFPILPPVTDRIIVNYFPELPAYLPEMHKSITLVPFVFTNIILLLLSVWDLRSRPRRLVFPAILAMMLVFQVFSLSAYHMPYWREFSAWFLRLG